jgi:regulator of sirC expression with transglutaminase-like and TPR domain
LRACCATSRSCTARNEDWQRLIAVLDRMVILLPTEWQELRDRGLAHAA